MERTQLTAEEPRDLIVWIDLGTYGTTETTPCLFSYDPERPDSFGMMFDVVGEEGSELVTVQLDRDALRACLDGESPPNPEERTAVQTWLSDDQEHVVFMFFRDVTGTAFATARHLRELLDQSYSLMSLDAEQASIAAMINRELGLNG
jgi:hypothetical protein